MRVRIGQLGEMWQKPGGRAVRFEAVEEFEIEEVAFWWRALFSILPLVWLRVVNRYGAGEGLLEARLLGLLRVMRRHCPEADWGEAMRCLAELPLVPQAMLSNRQLNWRELDEQMVGVATQVGSERVTVGLEFDAAGDVVGSSADARPRAFGKDGADTLVGQLRRLHGRRWHPDTGACRSQMGLPEKPSTYWRGTVTWVNRDS